MRFSQRFDGWLDEIQAILLSILTKLGPFAVALMPALFTAYAIYYTYRPESGENLALFFAIVVGLAMETVGIIATHTAIDLYNGKQAGVIEAGKFWLMVFLVPAYVLGVAGTVYYSENAFTPLVRNLGIASPFLTCIVYIAVALARDLSKIKQGQAEQHQQDTSMLQEDRAFQRQLKLKQMEQEQERKLREQELNAKVQIEQAKAQALSQPSQLEAELVQTLSQLKQTRLEPEPAQSQHYQCENCGRDFGTVQALNAHSRFCVTVKANGKH